MSSTVANIFIGLPTRKLAYVCFAALAAFGFVAYLPLLLNLLQSLGWYGLDMTLVDRDFANYWMAGRLVVAGEQQDLFIQTVYLARLQEMFGPTYPAASFGYPPHFLLLLWPLGYLGFKAALVGFLGATLALFLYSAHVFRRYRLPGSPWLILVVALVPCSMMALEATQSGFLMAALLLLGLAFKDERPWASGIAFGLLTVKPQLAILVPVLLLLDRNYRALGWAAGTTLALLLVSTLAFGFESWQAYLTDTLAWQRSVVADWQGSVLQTMPTIFGAARLAGFPPNVASALQWPVSIAGVALVAFVFWRDSDPLRRMFALLAGTFVIWPYGFNHDMGALAVVAALLVVSGRISQAYALTPVAIVAALPAAVMNLGRSGLPIATVLLLAGLAAVAWQSAPRRLLAPAGMAPGGLPAATPGPPTEIEHARLFSLLGLWALATVIAMFFALILRDSAIVGDVYVPRTNDSFYHARRILDAALSGNGLYQYEYRIDPPEGIWIPWPWAYDFFMSRLVQIALWFRPDANPMAVLAYVPVAWISVNAALFLGAASALRLSMGMRALAMLAFALSPLTQLLHGIGMIDHHFVEHSFVLLNIWLGIRWLREPARPGRAIALGVALGAAPGFHNGLFLLQLIPLATLLILWLRGAVPAPRSVRALAIALVVTTLLVALPSEPLRAGMFSFGYLSWFHVYVSVCTAAMLAGMAYRPISRRQAAILAAGAAVLAVPLLTQFVLGATFVSGGVSVLEHVTEAQSPLRLFTETMGPIDTVSYYSWLLLLVPLLLAAAAYWLTRERDPGNLYFAAAAVLGLGLMLMQFRFYYFGLFPLIAGLLMLVDGMRQRFGWHRGMVFVLTLALLVLAYQPALRQRLFTIYAIAADPEYQSAISIFVKLGEVCADDPGLVLANNDDGNAILFHSDCSVITNNFFLGAADQARVDEIGRLMRASPAELLAADPPIKYLFVRRDDFSTVRDERAFLDLSNPIIAQLFVQDESAELPDGFELLSSVYALPAPDAELVTHARLYKLTPPGPAE